MAYDNEISEEDIDVMLRHLQYTEPEHATRVEALKRLKDAQDEMRDLGTEDPEKLHEIQKKIDKNKDSTDQ